LCTHKSNKCRQFAPNLLYLNYNAYKSFSKELGRNLNTDEAIALGAIYQAARVSQKFIVKRFDVADSALPEQSVQLKPMNEQEIVLAKAM
jgi:hypothetical protein